ncbi:MAG TPA: MFS transporter, partial [Acidimicrobiales bacterium]|nr:MFS transporter [Acidimicrobiales bacterium]
MRLLADVRPLRESRPFRRLWWASTLSSVGSALTAFALPLQVYDLTRSPLAVGALGVAEMVPTLAIGLLGGSLADAVDRRKLILAMTTCSAAVSVALAAQAYIPLHALWLLYTLAALQSAAGAVRAPAQRALVPSLLPRHLLPAGLALNRLSFQVMLIAGPAVAGLIAGVPALGLPACYLADAVSFSASLYAVARLPVLGREDSSPRPSARAVAEGISFIRRSQRLAGALLADLDSTVFALPVALFPAINAQRFGGDPRTLGLFMTAIGVGGLLSATFSGPLHHISRQGLAMLGAVVVWGGAFAGFALVRGLWPTLLLLGLAGAADTVTVVFRGAIVQSSTPEHLRGRVTAAEFVVGAGGGQLGNLESGALGSLTSPGVSALAGGLVTVAGAIALGLALPGLRRYRARPDPTVPEAAGGAASG